jgi:hypothetical protein
VLLLSLLACPDPASTAPVDSAPAVVCEIQAPTLAPTCQGTEASLDCDGDGVADACQPTLDCVTTGPNDWYAYHPGTLPIVLSAPHGGTLQPDELDTRPDASTGGDTNTQQLAFAISDALYAQTGGRPHVVVMNLHRYKVEANAWTLETATAGQPDAVAAYEGYHALIAAAVASVEAHYGRGLYIDLHGLASSRTHMELGYLLSGSTYLVDDARLDHPGYREISSLRGLDAPFSQLVRGPQSFGGLLQEQGYPSVPSPDDPWPTDEDGEPRGYFEGGYSTHRHGSRLGGPWSGCSWRLCGVGCGTRRTRARRSPTPWRTRARSGSRRGWT